MDKKNIYLNLPCELIDKIDSINNLGDRSEFIRDLLERQLRENQTVTKITEK